MGTFLWNNGCRMQGPLQPCPPPPPREIPSDFRYQASFLIPMGVGFSLMEVIFGVTALLLYRWLPKEALLGLIGLPLAPLCLYFGLRLRRRARTVYRDGHVTMGHVVRLSVRGRNDAIRP